MFWRISSWKKGTLYFNTPQFMHDDCNYDHISLFHLSENINNQQQRQDLTFKDNS